MSDTYRTVAAEASATVKVEGSRFIAEVAPVTTREGADRRIDATRRREHKATHHCFAFRLGVSGDDVRYNDDGEPSGTAGPPILRQIDARNLTNTLVVVTRYFGGTKLGTGGLARAYGEAAEAALERTTVVEKVVRVPVQIRFAYDDTAPVRRLLQQYDVEVTAEDYTAVTELRVGVRRSDVEAFVEAFTDALSDRGTVLQVGGEGGSSEERSST